MKEKPASHLKSISIHQTSDGSWSGRCLEAGENLHSKEGAWQETFHNYIEPAQLERFQNRSFKLLEVGLGLGVGFLATFHRLQQISFSGNMHYIALEKNPELVQLFMSDNSQVGKFESLNQPWGVIHRAQHPFGTLEILEGGATKALSWLVTRGDKFQVVYQDPFSPRNNPSLWSRAWFEALSSACDHQCRLSTFCSATKPRRILEELDWIVSKHPGYGRKREMMVAIKQNCGENVTSCHLR